MSIQVEMPKWKYLVKVNRGGWFATTLKPVLWSESGELNWDIVGGNSCSCEKVTGYRGGWKDSLHKWNGKEWEKVK